MTTRPSPDRLRGFVDALVAGLDEPAGRLAFARRALISPFHLDRLVSAALGETPTAMRRRLLLERAAWRLGMGWSVTDAAVEAGYRSVDGFARAFARAFGTSPSRHRIPRGFRANAPNGVHFHPPGAIAIAGPRTEGAQMDLTERLVDHDRWLTDRLLDRAATLPGDDLDRPVFSDWQRMPFDADAPTVRSMLARLVWTKENWNASVAGRAEPEETDDTIDGLRRRHAVAGEEFTRLARSVRDRGGWEEGFVDALCDPPESFTFGGMLAHVITFSAYRRQVLIKALERIGVRDVGIGDPNEWERALDGGSAE